MRISFVPRYPPWGASSRLRVYTIHDELLKMGHDSVIGYDPNADVVVFQKAQQPPDPASKPPRKPLIIYDFDDREMYPYLEAWNDYAHIFTTDTEGHAKECGFDCEVIPDPIDFCPEAPLPPSDGSGAVWFGHYLNYPSVRPWIQELVKAGVKCRLISNVELAEKAREDGTEFVQWSLETFVTELRKSAVAVLSHDGGDPYKSNNRALLAITHGLVYIGSNTPAYLELMREIRNFHQLSYVEASVSGGFPSVYALALERREEALVRAQPYVWEHYHPRVIAQQWLTLMEKYR